MKRKTTARAHVANGKTKATGIKSIFKRSMKSIKKHPRSSIGIFTLGAGLLSGMLILARKKHSGIRRFF